MAERRPTMMDPPIEALLDRVDSKYTLVSLAAKRGREVNSYFNQLGEGLGSIVPPAGDLDLPQAAVHRSGRGGRREDHLPSHHRPGRRGRRGRGGRAGRLSLLSLLSCPGGSAV